MTPHDLIAAFEAVAEAPDGIARLRELILQLAVRGRLVPQDPADEPANVLIQKIRDSGVARRAGDAAMVEAVDARWELPTSWCWIRLSEIANFALGRTPPTKDSSYWEDDGGHPWVSIADMEHYGEVSATKRRVSDKAAAEVFRTPPAPKGTLLMSFKLTIGKVARLAVDAYHNEAIISVFPPVAEMDGYLFRFLPLVAAGVETNAAVKGQTLNSTSLTNLLVPLPPLAEQIRIVARVDELMGLLDRLAAARSSREGTRESARDSTLASLRKAVSPDEVEVAWNRFAERMDELVVDPTDVEPLRQAVLELAVRGRLVPQDPKDEPAGVLLERIAAEKMTLMKTAKTRRAKPLPTLLDDAVPYKVPKTWVWAQIGELTSSLDYGSSAKSSETGVVPVLRMGNLQGGEIDWDDLKFTNDTAEIETYALAPNTVLFNRTNSPALVGKTAIYRGERPAIFAGYLIRIAAVGGISPQYVNIWMNSQFARDWCARTKQDGVSQSNISAGKLATLHMALPPLAEQRRIVGRVDELMGLLDRLEERLTASRDTHAAFAAAAVHGVASGVESRLATVAAES